MNTSMNSGKKLVGIFILLLSLAWTFQTNAEGTKEIRPANSDQGYLVLDASWSEFGFYDTPEENRLHIHICHLDEIVYLGFNQQDGDVKFRIKDPSGAIVFTEQNIPKLGEEGFISSHARAIAGPAEIVGGNGYDALVFQPQTTGDFYIEFKRPNGRRDFNYFDITVASPSNQAIKGRIWSKAWMFSTRSFTARFAGKLFIYADDGIVTSLDFNGMQPFLFVVSANESGTQNTGNTVVDRQSTNGNQTYPQYKIFLNDPDEECYKTGEFGSVEGDPVITGCGLDRCINIKVDKPGNIEVLLNLNGVVGYQANTADRLLSANVVTGDNCIPWDSRDGMGNIVASGTPLQLEINYFNGLTHLPLFDVEGNTKGYIVELVRPLNADPTLNKPRLFWDDSKIIPPNPTKINLSGCTNVNGCHTWTWAGSDNVNTDYGNTNTINTWWYANIIYKQAQFTTKDVAIDANTQKTPEEGNDTTFCSTNSTIPLFGSVVGSTGGTWSGGGGVFSPNPRNLTSTYAPTDSEKTLGKVKLILTSDPVDGCPPLRDSLTLNLLPAPVVVANDITVCENVNTVTLNGTITNALGGEWSGGTNSFVPDKNDLFAVYTPSEAEKKSFAVLTLTSTGNGLCNAVKDELRINFTKGPVSIAGRDTSICAINPVFQLSGKVELASSGEWTGGNGAFNPNRATLNAKYTPTQAEIDNGSVTLSLSTVGNGDCNATIDQITISFITPPVVNAGSDRSVCANSTVTLQGSIPGTTGTWTGGTGTYSPNANTLNAVYTPSQAEITAGRAKLILSSVSTGCMQVRDTMEISFTAPPTIKAGDDRVVCSNNASINLNAIVTGASGVQWTSLGNGTFVPGPNVPNPVYVLSAEELKSTITSITATTTGNGGCNPEKDDILIQISPAPTANAGADQTICKNNPVIKLSGKTTNNPGSVAWSGGTGTWLTLPVTDTITYIPSANDLASGNVTLTFTANKSNCNAVSDQMVVNFTASPVAEAGPAQNICKNNAVVNLAGSLNGATSGTWSGGAGTFNPGTTNLNAAYTPSAAEITKGSFKLYLTSNAEGNCKPVKDSVIISVTPEPELNAGSDITVCSNNATVSLNGQITKIATGGVWSGGNGTFSGNSAQLNAKYTPTADEIKGGSMNLTLTSTGNGNCTAVTDAVKITFSPAPTSTPGADITICADNPVAKLNGSVTIAQGGIWSGGNGTFTPNANTLNASYKPTLDEVNAGTVSLVLTTTSNGTCNAVSASMKVIIVPAPIISAGSDQTACGNVNTLALNGSVSTATGGSWTSNGNGTFAPNANVLNPVYTPSKDDKSKGQVILTITSTGNGSCTAVSDQMKISFSPIPTVHAGPDQVICDNDFPVILKGSGSPASWIHGQGVYSPSRNLLNAGYTPTVGEVSSGKVTLVLATQGTVTCPSVSDTMTLTLKVGPKPNAGVAKTICGSNNSVELQGTINNPFGGIWTTAGTGSFSPDANALNASYSFSVADKKVGYVDFVLNSILNGECRSDSSIVRINITKAPIADAGPDEKICADASNILLNGEITQATNATWTSDGSGSFSPSNTALNAAYVPSAADKSKGSVSLTLTTGSDGICNAVSDIKLLTITPAPKIEAGQDITVCGDTSFIQLAGAVEIATGGRWSTSGSGVFAPDSYNLNAKYYPSSQDIAAGNVVLKLSSEGNGTCNVVSDSLRVIITPTPKANAGVDRTVCSDAPVTNLTGVTTVASGGRWTTSGTGNFSNANTVNTSYTPSAADINNRMVILTMTTTGNGMCKPVLDKMVLNITPVPTVNAGSDQTVCADVSGVRLIGRLTNIAKAKWKTAGTGTFTPNDSTLNALYIPSAQDTAARLVSITLTSAPLEGCGSRTDTVAIRFNPTPLVNAGTDQIVCADTSGIYLNGIVANALGGKWSTTGSGKFFPSSATVTARYVPSSNDKVTGTILFTLTTTGNGTCNAVTDNAIVRITPSPVVDAGTDTTTCADATTIPLNGNVTIATGAMWNTSGSGKFSPDSLTLNASYIPSEADKLIGAIHLTLTSKGNGTCAPATDSKKITIKPLARVNAGSDQTICGDLNSINLSGDVKISNSAVWSTTGSGTFTPTATNLNTTYLISSADKTAGKVKIILKSLDNGICSAVTDTLNLNITPVPTISAGADVKVCSTTNSVPLTGNVTVATGGVWSTSGTGTFVSSPNPLHPTYLLSAADKTAQVITLKVVSSGNGTCRSVEDQMVINVITPPSANAGRDTTICANNEFFRLNGIIANTTKATWSASGNGTFAPGKENLKAHYFPSASDKKLGKITFTLTTLANEGCQGVSDQMILNISPAPTLSAGPDITVCPNVPNVEIKPQVTVATGVYWFSSGSGTFTPDQTNLVYIPSAEDTTAGIVHFTVATLGNGVCNAVYDSVSVKFNRIPTINAGVDETVCLTSLPIQLKGDGAAGTWSGFTGTITPGIAALNATYSPSPAEIAANKAQLILTSSASGNCAPSKDTVVYTFIQGPVVNAGPDDEICETTASVHLNGNVTLATGGNWSTSGTGTFDNSGNTIASYTPSSDDKKSNSVTLTLTSSPYLMCNEVQDQVTVKFVKEPVVDAGPDQYLCSDATEVFVKGSAQYAQGVNWNAIPPTGSYDNEHAESTRYVLSPTDIANGSVTLVFTGLGGVACSDHEDMVNITILKPITVAAGNDQVLCASAKEVKLAAAKTVAGGVEWSSSGLGYFSPSINDANATYIPAPADTAAKQITLTVKTTENINCTAATDQLTVDFTPEPVINAGVDDEICAEVKHIILKAKAHNTGSTQWSTPGNGTFDNVSGLDAVYTVGENDKTRGAVILTIKSLNNNACPQVSDFKYVRILPIPGAVVNAGYDQLACITNNAIQMDGMVKGAGGGMWGALGTGTFLPNNTALNAIYKPSAQDTTNKSVKIFLITTDNGVCSAVSDSMTLSFAPAPVTNAGNPQTVCADTSYIPLNGTIKNTLQAVWTSSGSGSFVTSASDLSARYVPSTEDRMNGKIGLTLTSTDNGVCDASLSSVNMIITRQPTIDAGPDDSMCANSGKVQLKGIVSATQGLFWMSSGSGTFMPDQTNKEAQYIPSQEDIETGTVIIRARSTANGDCKPVSDLKILSILPAPVVNAGPDQTICADADGVNLKGNMIGASGGRWVSSGTGSFVPSNTDLDARYIPSPDDISNQNITITLQSGASYNCDAVTDELIVNILPQPESHPGEAVICDFMKGAEITGKTVNADGGKWSSSGTGTFSPDPFLSTTQPVIYKPSAADVANGEVTLTLTSFGKGTCKPVAASSSLKMIPPPVVDAGSDRIVCRGAQTVLTPKSNENLQYFWKKSGSNSETNAFEVAVTVDLFTQYVLKGTDSRGCSSFDTVGLNVIDPPVFSLDPHFCYDYNLLIDARPMNVPLVNGKFQWSKNGRSLQGENKSTIIPDNSGDYIIQYSFGNCVADDTTKITDAPQVTTLDKFGCVGDSTSLEANSLPGVKYDWFDNNAKKIGQSNPVKIWTVVDTNYYHVQATDLQYSCTGTDILRIIGLPKPTADLPGITACNNDTIILNGIPTNIPNLDSLVTTYVWTKNNVVLPVTSSYLKLTETGLYGLTVTTEICASHDTATIKFNPIPYSVPVKETEFCEKRDKQIILDAGTQPGLTYLWESSGSRNRFDTITTGGMYYVTLINQYNCTNRDSILVKNLCPPVIDVPNAFMPGSENEPFFRAFGKDFKNFKILVFSRWGEIIYYSEDKNESWDGKYKGEYMPIGVYPYIITYEGEAKDSPGPYKLEGVITIIR